MKTLAGILALCLLSTAALAQDFTWAELQRYAREMDFPWPAVDFNKKGQLAVLAWVLGRSSTPEFGVFDDCGNVIIDNGAVDRDAALKQLAALLDKPQPDP